MRPEGPHRLLLAALPLTLWAGIAFGGCSAGESDLSGEETLTIYLSAPLRGDSARSGRAIREGARLALEEAAGEAAGIRIEAVYLDNTDGKRWDPVVVARNARRATEDSTTIAYIGELESGATRTSLPITNRAGILQVSPGSSAVDLVREAPGSSDVPEHLQPSGERTFGRVIPGDDVQAAAGAAWMARRGARGLTAVSDGSAFGEAVGDAFVAGAQTLGLRAVCCPKLDRPPERCGVSASLGRRRLNTYYAGEAVPSRAEVSCSLVPAANATVMTTDALLARDRLAAIDARATETLVTSAALDPSQLPGRGQAFVRAYRERYGRSPDRYAAYGYEAMAAVLDSIERATEPDDRGSVIDAFLGTLDRRSVLGTYSIDAVGDTTLEEVTGFRIDGGRAVPAVRLSPP